MAIVAFEPICPATRRSRGLTLVTASGGKPGQVLQRSQRIEAIPERESRGGKPVFSCFSLRQMVENQGYAVVAGVPTYGPPT